MGARTRCATPSAASTATQFPHLPEGRFLTDRRRRSARVSSHFRAKQGLPAVTIGGDSFYSDPEVDEAEEAVEVVEAFFRDSPAFEEELKRTYAARRKDGKRDNW